MESPGRHSDAAAAAVSSPSKSSKECFEKLEKMHQTQNARLDEIMKRSEEQLTYIAHMLRSIGNYKGNISILNLMKLLKKGPEHQLTAHNSHNYKEQVHQQSVHYNDR